MLQKIYVDGSPVTVRACKFDGTEHRRWEATLSRIEDALLVLEGKFETEIRHDLLGRIAPGTLSIEYYWLDRWYSVLCFFEPGGQLRNYYCNVNVPPNFDGRVLSFVDLDVDVLVAPDFTYSILDEDEFAANTVLYDYPPEVVSRAHQAIEELERLILARQFPFSLQL